MRPDGDANPQDRLIRLGVDADRAAVALLDDATCDVEAKTGALAWVLGRVERLERPCRHRRRHPGTGIADLDDHDIPVSPRRYPQCSRPAHRVDGVVDELGPYLVEFAGVGLDPGDVGAVVAHDPDTVAEFVPEHDQGALKTVRDVDVLYRRTVHLGVGLEDGNEGGDTLGR